MAGDYHLSVRLDITEHDRSCVSVPWGARLYFAKPIPCNARHTVGTDSIKRLWKAIRLRQSAKLAPIGRSLSCKGIVCFCVPVGYYSTARPVDFAPCLRIGDAPSRIAICRIDACHNIICHITPRHIEIRGVAWRTHVRRCFHINLTFNKF